MTWETGLLEWRDFYIAVAGAGAALVGLVFVGASIQLSNRPLDSRIRILATMAVVNLLHPLIASLIMLVPGSPQVLGAGLLTLALAGLVGAIGIDRAKLRQPRIESRLWLVYRYFIPSAAELILAAGAIALILGSTLGLYAVPAFVFLMFIVGTQNAWDLLLGGGSTSRSEPLPERAVVVVTHGNSGGGS